MNNPTNREELQKLLAILPEPIRMTLENNARLEDLIEVVLDLGKPPEARFTDSLVYMRQSPVTDAELEHVVTRLGQFTSDNRAGIERTLHRISAIRNRMGRIIGLTCRVGRALYGTIQIIRDVVESGKSILILGAPGIGKTTKLRESARVLADDLGKRVVVVDTSNEIAGDGDIPHLGIGKARRMQVQSPERQHAVMIEAVENHMPEVIIVDEIGTEAEAIAARTIAERGVQLIGTAHGITLENVLKNPTLSDLLGGIQSVILSDEEAKRRKTQKAILERKAHPTFEIAVELREPDALAIYPDVAGAVDRILRGYPVHPEFRRKSAGGTIEIEKPTRDEFKELVEKHTPPYPLGEGEDRELKIYPFAVNRKHLDRGIRSLRLPAHVASTLDDADIVVTTKSRSRSGTKIMTGASEHQVPVHVIRRNTAAQIMKFLRYYFRVQKDVEIDEEGALREVELAIHQVQSSGKSADLSPQNAYIRRLQHQFVEQYRLKSQSVGEEPNRRLRVYPAL